VVRVRIDEYTRNFCRVRRKVERTAVRWRKVFRVSSARVPPKMRPRALPSTLVRLLRRPTTIHRTTPIHLTTYRRTPFWALQRTRPSRCRHCGETTTPRHVRIYEKRTFAYRNGFYGRYYGRAFTKNGFIISAIGRRQRYYTSKPFRNGQGPVAGFTVNGSSDGSTRRPFPCFPARAGQKSTSQYSPTRTRLILLDRAGPGGNVARIRYESVPACRVCRVNRITNEISGSKIDRKIIAFFDAIKRVTDSPRVMHGAKPISYGGLAT